MENPYWKLVKEEKKSGLDEILKNEINFLNPRPKPEDLVGMLNNNNNHFYIWIKGEKSRSVDRNKDPEWRWEADNVVPEKLADVLKDHGNNVVPLSINLPKHNPPVVWYLIRKQID